MVPYELFEKLAVVAAQGVLLFVLSRALFVWVLQALASRNPRARGGWLVLLVRLPGNLVHEISHALGFLICGYRVRRLVPCIFDRAGGGACQPGGRGPRSPSPGWPRAWQRWPRSWSGRRCCTESPSG